MKLLIINVAIDLILGLLLITFPLELFQLLGVPMVEHSFYLSILRGVLIEIGIALLIEYVRGPKATVGLGFLLLPILPGACWTDRPTVYPFTAVVFGERGITKN